MAHSFLIDPGYWQVTGHWLKPNQQKSLPLQGGIQIVWKQANWFKLTTSLTCQDDEDTKIIYQCRGNVNFDTNHYTYVSQHNLLGNIEGEGHLGHHSIVQYYWFIGTASKQKGLDTFFQINSNTYHLTSSILDGHSINSIIEAVVKR